MVEDEYFPYLFRIELATRHTHYLALKYYDNLEVCASCVAFLELIGQDTHELRLLINTEHIICRGKQLKGSSLDPKVVHYQVGKPFNRCTIWARIVDILSIVFSFLDL